MQTISYRNVKFQANSINKARVNIEEDILSGKLYPNQRLIEEEIAQRLKLSRTPVREALKQLETKGLVTRLATRGLVVTPITKETITNTFEVREALETKAIRLACDRATAKDIETAQKCLLKYEDELDALKKDGMKRRTRQPDETDWNEKFHVTLYGASGNLKLLYYIQDIRDVQQLAYVSRFFSEMDFDLFISQHRNILDAVRRHDKDAAEKAVIAHLRTVSDMYMKYLKG